MGSLGISNGKQQGDSPVQHVDGGTGDALQLHFCVHFSVTRHGHGPVGVLFIPKLVNLYRYIYFDGQQLGLGFVIQHGLP